MILVFGSVNLDLIFPLPALPRPGQTVLGSMLRVDPILGQRRPYLLSMKAGTRADCAFAIGALSTAGPPQNPSDGGSA